MRTWAYAYMSAAEGTRILHSTLECCTRLARQFCAAEGPRMLHSTLSAALGSLASFAHLLENGL
jgi:hypothetical protein